MTSEPQDPASLRAEIERETERLKALNAEREASAERLARLRQRLAEVGVGSSTGHSSESTSPKPQRPSTAREKVALFGRLFRGRTDVFPAAFVNRRNGRPGYAPECRNKFVPGVCRLPSVKCGECPNQAFVPVDSQALLGHLQGRRVVGVYPLLNDETCWFLAVDFDGRSWQEDSAAFRQICRTMGVPCGLERSRSGEGAHAWIFFTAPGGYRPRDGLPPTHRDHGQQGSTRNALLRPPLPEPGYPAARRVR
ncbi:TOTE conflict system archaeo-eukaryotic primase domain-containing protein [Halorhodospira halophila]|uniref:TOTE conflict system archaeo-eukaryotic primase domain-containing protein n=1 Tax=Halorhodospira halophila TaxID=1053 RepID=UPI003D36C394